MLLLKLENVCEQWRVRVISLSFAMDHHPRIILGSLVKDSPSFQRGFLLRLRVSSHPDHQIIDTFGLRDPAYEGQKSLRHFRTPPFT